MALGQRIKEARNARKISQAELARRVSKLTGNSVKQSAIGTLEARNSNKSLLALPISYALGVPISWLVQGGGRWLYDVEAMHCENLANHKAGIDEIIDEALGLEGGRNYSKIAEFCETTVEEFEKWRRAETFPSYYQLCLIAKLGGIAHIHAFFTRSNDRHSVLGEFVANAHGAATPQAQAVRAHKIKSIDSSEEYQIDPRFIKPAVERDSSLKVVNCEDNAMSPRINNGDYVLIDAEKTSVEDGKTYAIDYGGEIRFRLVLKGFDGSLTLVSGDPNGNHSREIVPTNQIDKLKVIGQALWVGSNL